MEKKALISSCCTVAQASLSSLLEHFTPFSVSLKPAGFVVQPMETRDANPKGRKRQSFAFI